MQIESSANYRCSLLLARTTINIIFLPISFIMYCCLYAFIIGSVTVVRFGTEGSESPSTFRIATAILLAITSIGPALLADWLARKLKITTLHSRARQVARRRRLEVEREVARSDRAITDLSMRTEAWRSETARFRARYDAAYRRTRAEIESNNPPRERGAK